MRSSAHFSSGLILWLLLNSIHNPLSFVNTFLLIIAVVFLDIDILGKYFFSKKNHRRYFTHSPIFWLFLIAVSYLFSIEVIFWFSIGCLFHLLLDIIDWGIPYLPTKNSGLIPHLLEVKSSLHSEKDFSRIYWNNNYILRLEQIFFIASLLILFILFTSSTDISLIFLFSLLLIFTSTFSTFDYITSKKKYV